MPTESDFLHAARLFEEASDEVSATPNLIAGSFGPDVLTGGQLAMEVDLFVTRVENECAADAVELAELATLCRERAAVVAAYAEAMNHFTSRSLSHSYAYDRWLGDLRDWEQSPETHDHPGRRPTPPSRPNRPAAWVEI